MAVPFNIPEDQNEVEVLINQLQALLTKLQAAIRRSRDSRNVGPPQLQQEQPSTSRVRQNGSTRSTRARDEAASTNSSSIPPNIPDLLNNLAWLAAMSQESTTVSSSTLPLTSVSIARSSRRRTTSESSNCEETKIATVSITSHGINQSWNQVGSEPTSPLPKLFSANGILSKIVPGPVSAPLWTAMICFVGWHLFKAR